MSAYSRSSRFCFLLLVPILALALSCSKADQPKTDAISITSGNNISFPAGVSSQTVYFNASGSWTATISDDDASSWLSIYPDHGNNDGSIIVAATEIRRTVVPLYGLLVAPLPNQFRFCKKAAAQVFRKAMQNCPCQTKATVIITMVLYTPTR